MKNSNLQHGPLYETYLLPREGFHHNTCIPNKKRKCLKYNIIWLWPHCLLHLVSYSTGGHHKLKNKLSFYLILGWLCGYSEQRTTSHIIGALKMLPLSIATPVRSSALGVVPNSSTSRQMKAVQLWRAFKINSVSYMHWKTTNSYISFNLCV